MKALVTGHEGFIGGYLFDALKTNGYEVIGADRKSGTDVLVSDLPDADIIFHLAAQTRVTESVKDPIKDATDNILATIRIAQRYRGNRIIYTSSAGAIQETIGSPYGLSKKTGEDYLNLLNENTVVCRLPNVAGKGGAGVIEIFKNSEKNTIYGDGKQVRDYVHVEDIVRGLIMAVDWSPGLYELGSGKGMTVLEIAEAIGKPYEFADAREGELLVSKCKNTTPNWKPEVDIMDYIRNSG